MPLAIVTPIGQAHELRGRRLLEQFGNAFAAEFVPTPPDLPAALDGVMVRNGVLRAVVECKTRVGYDLSAIRRMGGTVLITADKLDALRASARALGVPGFVVVTFADGHSWYWKVANPDGSAGCQWTSRKSTTRSDSIGGGDVVRLNAFLPLDEGVCWQWPEQTAVTG